MQDSLSQAEKAEHDHDHDDQTDDVDDGMHDVSSGSRQKTLTPVKSFVRSPQLA